MIKLKQTFKIESLPYKPNTHRTQLEAEILHPSAEKTYTIYKLTSQSTNRSYVGCTSDMNRRLQQHIAVSGNPKDVEYNYPLHKAIRQYGIEDFDLEILDSSDDKDFAFNVIERGCIEMHDTYRSGYNSTKGGVGGFGRHVSAEERKTRRLLCLRDAVKISRRMSRRNKNSRWITNGVKSLRLENGKRVPTGFRLGRSVHQFKKAA